MMKKLQRLKSRLQAAGLDVLRIGCVKGGETK